MIQLKVRRAPPGGKNENEVKPDFLQNDNPVQNSAHAVLLSSSHFSLSQKSRTHSCPFKAHNLLLCEMVLMPNILRPRLLRLTNSLSIRRFAILQLRVAADNRNYGRPMKPFSIEIAIFWAWANKVWGTWGIFWPNQRSDNFEMSFCCLQFFQKTNKNSSN